MSDKPGKWMFAKYDGRCGECQRRVEQGELIYYVFSEKCALCEECGKAVESDRKEEER